MSRPSACSGSHRHRQLRPRPGDGQFRGNPCGRLLRQRVHPDPHMGHGGRVWQHQRTRASGARARHHTSRACWRHRNHDPSTNTRWAALPPTPLGRSWAIWAKCLSGIGQLQRVRRALHVLRRPTSGGVPCNLTPTLTSRRPRSFGRTPSPTLAATWNWRSHHPLGRCHPARLRLCPVECILQLRLRSGVGRCDRLDETDNDVTITLAVDSVDSFCDNQLCCTAPGRRRTIAQPNHRAANHHRVGRGGTTLIVPESYTAECGGDHPMEDAEAFDNCGDVTLVTETDTHNSTASTW